MKTITVITKTIVTITETLDRNKHLDYCSREPGLSRRMAVCPDIVPRFIKGIDRDTLPAAITVTISNEPFAGSRTLYLKSPAYYGGSDGVDVWHWGSTARSAWTWTKNQSQYNVKNGGFYSYAHDRIRELYPRDQLLKITPENPLPLYVKMEVAETAETAETVPTV